MGSEIMLSFYRLTLFGLDRRLTSRLTSKTNIFIKRFSKYAEFLPTFYRNCAKLTTKCKRGKERGSISAEVLCYA